MNLSSAFCVWLLFIISCVSSQSRFNPSIIQDSRVEPKVDGTFGFQYRTEDGISHSAQGDPTGYIQGSYSYKDPTGLKVNFNYFAGARNNANSSPPQGGLPQYNRPEPMEYPRETEPDQSPYKYVPRTRPPASYTRSQYQPSYSGRFTQSVVNEVYDNTDYSQYAI
ncbi:uncharacterized protein LOC109532823 [Dendroctonus ponderosae]|uniref:uncharacterized protein LOC109532823 n=1 Tax=Dendroctonus ponderosae TaxID=77166 RepID=UPI002036544B|nr:uncharacterized protein LOC109532823 [Dendroctonus ponderosae]